MVSEEETLVFDVLFMESGLRILDMLPCAEPNVKSQLSRMIVIVSSMAV